MDFFRVAIYRVAYPAILFLRYLLFISTRSSTAALFFSKSLGTNRSGNFFTSSIAVFLICVVLMLPRVSPLYM